MYLLFNILLILLFTYHSLFANETVSKWGNSKFHQEILKPEENGATITIQYQNHVGELIETYNNLRKSNEYIPVYQIRIFSKSGNNAKSQAIDEIERFKSLFPGINPYLTWDAPNFKVYVGEYRTHLDAFKALKKIKKEFPNAFYIPPSQKLFHKMVQQ